MSKITINIDGKAVETTEGEYILNAARANDIFIPAICYLTRCSPTLACRLCLVEVDGKQAYACNAKSKEGMNISTMTPNIAIERRSIMEVYDVNHPLECGVCDQSGECELQNYTLEMEVDFQSYSIKDVDRPSLNWGDIHYNSGLCIMCERCTTVCKDMIGDRALTTVPRGSDAISAEQKDSMPKDAYAMWNKLNKSLIGITSGAEQLDCTQCGECAAVCPVGALVDTHYIYSTNAWEQKQIPATCAHCSAGCHIYYETKHTSIDDVEEKIYRVTNEWNYVSLCGAGRYGFDFENRDAVKDEEAFTRALEAFNRADSIRFSSVITNEEALILQKLKELKGYRLINDDARIFGEFMGEYSRLSGKSLYSGDLEKTLNSDFIVSLGSALKHDNPVARYALNNPLTVNKGAGLYFHSVQDSIIEGFGKSITTIYHKPLQEETVLYLLLDLFGDKEKLPKGIVEYLASFHSTKTITVEESIKEEVIETLKVMKKDEESGEEIEVEEQKKSFVTKKISKDVEVDDNALLAMVGADDKFMETLEKSLAKKEKFALIAGEDLYAHPNSKNIARLLALLERCSAFEITMLPNGTNTLGVSLICDLDAKAGEFSIGYNASGDFRLSALGDADLDMPAMNQQEGTLTSVNKRVQPTNAALSYGGYTLNDIANALGLDAKHTVEYTKDLPQAKGFKQIEFDNLDDYYSNDGVSHRGYLLESLDVAVDSDESVERIALEPLEGQIIYLADPVRQFSSFTQKSSIIKEESGLYMSEDAIQKGQFKEGERVRVKSSNGVVETKVQKDETIKGEIMLLSAFDKNLDSKALFDGYRFALATIERV